MRRRRGTYLGALLEAHAFRWLVLRGKLVNLSPGRAQAACKFLDFVLNELYAPCIRALYSLTELSSALMCCLWPGLCNLGPTRLLRSRSLSVRGRWISSPERKGTLNNQAANVRWVLSGIRLPTQQMQLCARPESRGLPSASGLEEGIGSCAGIHPASSNISELHLTLAGWRSVARSAPCSLRKCACSKCNTDRLCVIEAVGCSGCL